MDYAIGGFAAMVAISVIFPVHATLAVLVVGWLGFYAGKRS